MVGGKVAALAINFSKRLLEDAAQDGGVLQHRRAGGIVVVPDLVAGMKHRIGGEVVDQIGERDRSRLQAVHHEQWNAVRVVSCIR